MRFNSSHPQKSKYVKELKHYIGLIKDSKLRDKVSSFLTDINMTFDGKNYSVDFENAPASKRQHHSFPSGLLIHMIATTKFALAMADVLENYYHATLNRDLIIAGSLLHDIMKPITYDESNGGSYSMSGLGERLDHISLAVAELYKRDFPLDLIHIVASHHGTSGPTWPKSLEAWVVHFADYVDSQFVGITMQTSQGLLKSIVKSNVKIESPELMFLIFQTAFYKGREAVVKLWESKLKNDKRIKIGANTESPKT